MMDRRTFIASVLSLTFLSVEFSSCVSAAPITVRFDGRLWGPTIPTRYLDPPVPVGAEFTGTYTFDPETAKDGFPHELDFRGPPDGMVLELGPHRFASDTLTIRVENNAFDGEYDRYVVSTELYDESGIEGFESSEIELLRISWGLTDSTASVLSDSSVTTIPLNLGLWNTNFFNVSGWRMPNFQLHDAFQVYGQVNSVSLVPEPGTDVLAVVALIGLAWYPVRRVIPTSLHH